MTPLKPCPFCGETQKVFILCNDIVDSIECEECGAVVEFPNQVDAATAWNTRTEPKIYPGEQCPS